MSQNIYESEDNFNITFSPPVYRQRYDAVLELSRQLKPTKVVDMGCGECKLLKLLRFHKHIERLIGVDIAAESLRDNQRLVQPLISDYLIRRPKPLTVQLLNGSIDEADSRLLNCDLLSCMEVIEHLHQPVLERVPAVIFQLLRPAVVIVSTPNSDFNVLFPRMTGFRHFDHKFEWNRREFQSWCFKICSMYSYKVKFDGAGDPPVTHTHLGHCSQIATFTSTQQLPTTGVIDTPYQLIFECEYPYERNSISPGQRLAYEIQYILHQILRRREEDLYLLDSGSLTNGFHAVSDISLDQHTTRNIIQLAEIMEYPQIQHLTSNIDDIRNAIQEYTDIQLTDDRLSVIYIEEESDISEDEGSEGDNSDSEGYNIGYVIEEESWD